MEQDDLANFEYVGQDESGSPGELNCHNCSPANTVKTYEFRSRNLLELMKDAAAHFAAVHRKTDGT